MPLKLIVTCDLVNRGRLAVKASTPMAHGATMAKATSNAHAVIPSLKVVAEPLLSIGKPEAESLEIAEALLEELNIPRKLWPLSPTTFSGGEQQRVNIARGFSYAFPVLLLDEPTASLDKENRDIVISLINRAKSKGTAIVGIFHDQQARELICDREVDVRKFTPNLNGNDA